MKRRGKRRLGRGKFSTFIALLCFIAALFIAVDSEGVDEFLGELSAVESEFINENVYVHFIDVGQGSSTLIQNGTSGILIDSGESNYSDEVIQYLQNCGIETLDYVVATHPHSDHIGGMTAIFAEFEVGTIIMPELSSINTPTTQTYEKFIDYILENDLDVDYAQPYTEYDFCGDELLLIAPFEQDSNLNNMSVVSIFTSGDTRVLVSGDAEVEELATIDLTMDIDCDFGTMSHHGSSNGIYEPFLDAVDMEVAIISCGTDNSYGHPHSETITYLEENEIEYYITCVVSTVIFEITDDAYSIYS
ncbi:MAG: MBL fold metallo-hydrolase [Clostridia bacterium]